MKSLVLAAVLLACSACSTTVVVVPGSAPAAVQVGGLPDPRGWEKAWIDTTCEDFTTRMNDDQKAAFARYMLDTQRRRTLASAPDALGSLVRDFMTAMAAACGQWYKPTDQVIAAAGFVYLQEPQKYQPPYNP